MTLLKSKLPEITLKYKSGETQRVKISDSRTSYDLLKKLYDADTIEYCESAIVLFLNRVNNTIGWFKVSQGGITGTIIDKRMVLVTALNTGATSIIISHNHPSGNLNPSNMDISMTKELKAGCHAIGIDLLDHIIVTADKFYSFTDEGIL